MTDVSKLPLAETVVEDDDRQPPGERDRIVILGRRASGKTVYLSVLYERYWRSLDTLTMKAVSGNVHTDLIKVVDGLRSGRWPAATLETQHCDLHVNYKGCRHLLVALDYAGELFRRAFVEDVTDSPETAALVRHIDSAAAVMMLIDPAIAVGGNVDATVDDDFGMTQAVTRIRNWPGGGEIPFVLVFTKADENRELIHREGGLEAFVRRYFPALARTLKKVPIFQVAAVQAELLADGTKMPRKDSVAWQIEKPLLYCLDQIDLKLELQRQDAWHRLQRFRADQRLRQEKRAARRTARILVAVVASMIVIAACVIALIWVKQS